MQMFASKSGEGGAGKMPPGLGPITGGVSGAAMAALPLLLREVALRPQLKRQRQAHRDLAAQVEAGQFGPGAAELQRRDAQMRDQLRQQMETQSRAQERMSAVGGSPADMARLQQAGARAQAQAAMAGSQQLVQQVRQEKRMDELAKRQQLADMDARREAFTNAAISQIMQGAKEGAGMAGQASAAQQMGVPFTGAPMTPEMILAQVEAERRKREAEMQAAAAAANSAAPATGAPTSLAYDPRT